MHVFLVCNECEYVIEILDLECVLGHVTGIQIENKNALINPPC
jgi:hypothetical protein